MRYDERILKLQTIAIQYEKNSKWKKNILHNCSLFSIFIFIFEIVFIFSNNNNIHAFNHSKKHAKKFQFKLLTDVCYNIWLNNIYDTIIHNIKYENTHTNSFHHMTAHISAAVYSDCIEFTHEHIKFPIFDILAITIFFRVAYRIAYRTVLFFLALNKCQFIRRNCKNAHNSRDFLEKYYGIVKDNYLDILDVLKTFDCVFWSAPCGII